MEEILIILITINIIILYKYVMTDMKLLVKENYSINI